MTLLEVDILAVMLCYAALERQVGRLPGTENRGEEKSESAFISVPKTGLLATLSKIYYVHSDAIRAARCKDEERWYPTHGK